MNLQLTMPLTGKLSLDYGKRENMEEEDLLLYAKEIQRAFENRREFAHLQDTDRFLKWFRGGTDIWKKVIGMKTMAVPDKNGLFADMEFYCRNALTGSERSELSKYVDQQFAYGMGKKLLSHPISVPGGELRIQMWNPFSSDFFIDPQGEPANPKYRITDITHPRYPNLKRIQALTDISEDVKRGNLGGFVEKEWNLSQKGGCWIYPNAICRESARVQGNARLYDNTQACGRAVVTGEADLLGYSIVKGDSYIRDAELRGAVMICGDAVVESNNNPEKAPSISGKSRIYGAVSGWFTIENTAVFPEEKLRNPTRDLMIIEHGKKRVLTEREVYGEYVKESGRKARQPER